LRSFERKHCLWASSGSLLRTLPWFSIFTGDLVLLITDGFFEWANAADEQFGVERLADSVRKFSKLPPEQIIAELYHAVLAFANGTKQNDDLTAVVIKRVGTQDHKPTP
jgi:serine phosphatase RsbU (regulator of sigma subunit)